MRIAMFTNVYAPMVGGIEKSVEWFCEDFRAAGHETLVVTPEFHGHEQSTDDVLRVPAIMNFNGSDFSVTLPFPARITERLDDFAPDLIHCHQPFLLGDAGLRQARHRGIPLVFTNHTLYERYTHYVPLDSERVRRMAVRMPVLFANLCDHVVAPTQSIAELLRQRGLERPATVIPTGIDTRFFANGDGASFRERYAIPAEATVLGHLGRLNREKNLVYLARALARALRGREGVWLLLVGEGDATQMMHSVFESEGVSERVVFAGRHTGQGVADAYAAMDLFLFASKTDTQGIVLLEAFAAGVPIVALRATGPRDLIEDGKTGRLLAEDADDAAFAGAIEELLDDPEGLQRMSRAAAHVADRYDRRECARRMLKLYEEVLAREAPHDKHLTPWESFLEDIGAEWELWSARFEAAAEATLEEEAEQQGRPGEE